MTDHDTLRTARALLRTVDKLLAYEIDTTRPADGRRLVGDERLALTSATQQLARLRAAAKHPQTLAGRQAVARLEAEVERVKAVERKALRTLSLWAEVSR